MSITLSRGMAQQHEKRRVHFSYKYSTLCIFNYKNKEVTIIDINSETDKQVGSANQCLKSQSILVYRSCLGLVRFRHFDTILYWY